MREKYKIFKQTTRDDGYRRALHLAGKYIVSTVPKRGVPYYYQTRALYNWHTSGSYTYRPDPFKIIEVSPAEIQYRSGNRFSYMGNLYYDSGLVKGGDWDQSGIKFDEPYRGEDGEWKNLVYYSLEQRFDRGYEWEDTAIVNRTFERIDSGRSSWHGCSTEQDVMDRCEMLDKLYQDIKENGYKSRKELLSESGEQQTNPQWFWQCYDEVVVNIGRDGELLFVGGHHRLSIAKLLDLEKIPVRIFVRHAKWQEHIDRCSDSTGCETVHPDLRELKD